MPGVTYLIRLLSDLPVYCQSTSHQPAIKQCGTRLKDARRHDPLVEILNGSKVCTYPRVKGRRGVSCRLQPIF